jgi:signal transduction histidine kinase/ActR/RegA family two-component response regulator
MKSNDAHQNPPPSGPPAELRQRAERSLSERRKQAPPQPTDAASERQRHELEVHQIELEMQNAELLGARTELEAALEKYTDLYDFAPVGYLTLDAAGLIRQTNLTGASLLGLERSRLVKWRFELFVVAPDRATWKEFLARVFASNTSQTCELALLKDGRPPLEVRLEAGAAASGLECRVVVTDITSQREAEANRLILSKLESAAILAGGIAHDFNNLLTVILMNVELGLRSAPGAADFETYLADARKAVMRARGLTQQFVTFTSGGEPFRKPTALAGLIQEAAQLALSGSRVQFEFVPPPDLWLVDVDEGQLVQVFQNLVLNAREAMPTGGGVTAQAKNVILKSGEVPPLPPGEYVQVSITDSGGGIPREIQAKIFDPYFSTKQRGEQKGMGLGLTICHAIIKRHGGAITVASRLGEGTTFHLHLPASRALRHDEPQPLAPKIPARRGRILVMDDEEGLRAALGVALRGLGHEVVLVADGLQAVAAYESSQKQGLLFDAVILDLTVKAGMGGQETLPKLLAMDPGVKAIVMSGYAQEPVLVDYERHGFKGGLAKPFEFIALGEILARVMGESQDHGTTP